MLDGIASSAQMLRYFATTPFHLDKSIYKSFACVPLRVTRSLIGIVDGKPRIAGNGELHIIIIYPKGEAPTADAFVKHALRTFYLLGAAVKCVKFE